MIDFDEYNKIKGKTVLGRLHAGEFVFDSKGLKYFLNKENNFKLFVTNGIDLEECDRKFNELLEKDWFIPKPFDARKEMLKKPNQWIAKILDPETNTWNYIGFSNKKMHAAKTDDLLEKFDEIIEGKEVSVPTDEQLDNAVPLDQSDQVALYFVKSK